MKVLTVVGARPNFIKAVSVSKALAKNYITEVVIHTGQHYDYNMNQVFFDELDIRSPKINLGIKCDSKEFLDEMVFGISKQIEEHSPDIVLVYGDTNSTLAGALAANKCSIPLAHVEAGLRSCDNDMVEEQNRIITDRLSQYLFCPSEWAKKQLEIESIDGSIFVVGDVMLDTFLNYFTKEFVYSNFLPDGSGPFVLATIHRKENVKLADKILEIINNISLPVVFPLHPRLGKEIDQSKYQNINFIPPQSYVHLHSLLYQCSFVVTDSGGLQREAYYARKKSLVIRDKTEWRELVSAGVCRLVRIDDLESFEDDISWARNSFNIFNSWPDGIYGEGKASEEIAEVLKGVIKWDSS